MEGLGDEEDRHEVLRRLLKGNVTRLTQERVGFRKATALCGQIDSFCSWSAKRMRSSGNCCPVGRAFSTVGAEALKQLRAVSKSIRKDLESWAKLDADARRLACKAFETQHCRRMVESLLHISYAHLTLQKTERCCRNPEEARSPLLGHDPPPANAVADLQSLLDSFTD